MTTAIASFSRLRFRAGVPVRRPFLGVEVCPFANGTLVRVSLWPMRYGFYVTWWHEPK